jgi:NADH dehydrogenase
MNTAQKDSRGRRIVIVGGGFGGAYCAQKLERLFPDRAVETVLLDRNNFITFYPLLVEAGTGSLEPRHAVVSTRHFLRRTRFIMAEVIGVDFESRAVSYRLPDATRPASLTFDHLVLALGSVTMLPEVPGLHDHGFEMKSLADAVTLRDRAIRKLEHADAIDEPAERKRLLHFVVVGASFTGVEVAGEFEVFLRQACRHYPNLDPSDVSITVVEKSDRILPALDEEMGRYALRVLTRRGIDVRLNSTVTRVEPRCAELDSGEALDADTVIWCAGIAPNPLIEKLSLPTDSRGYIRCEPDLRVESFDTVWAIGDAAVNVDPNGEAYPATAQHAVRQGEELARNLARVLRGQAARPCRITNRGSLAALGCRTGVAKVFGVKLSGFSAWFLWRTVYLFKMPGWARKLRVGLDWTMDLIFPKDEVQLGLAQRTRRTADEEAPQEVASHVADS